MRCRAACTRLRFAPPLSSQCLTHTQKHTHTHSPTPLEHPSPLWPSQVLLTRNTPGYCATQLLRAPLSQRRAALLATLLELAALPVLMVAPLAGRLPLGSTLAEELPSGETSAARGVGGGGGGGHRL